MKPNIGIALLERRQILLQGTIDGCKQEEISAGILYLNALDLKLPISLFIDSNGGNSDIGNYVCDAIRNSHAPVYGIVIGLCGSAAFNILQSCQKRIAYRNAHLLFHSARIRDFRISANRRKMIQWLDESRLKDQKIIKLLSQRTGQELKQLKKWSEEERRFTAIEALRLRFIDEIR